MSLLGSARVLLVEDEIEIARVVLSYLREAGYTARHALNGAEAMRLFNAEPHQLIILDWMLPDTDGVSLCKQIRRSSNVPVLMLTAKDAESDKVEALEAGADDYVTKPFSSAELIARCKALLRRSHSKTPGARTITWGDSVVLDAATRKAELHGDPISLAPKEFDLLWAVMEAEGAVLDRKDLLENVWGYTYYGDTRTVDVHVRQLRRKLGDACPIETVWGKGYRLREA